jgi:hypothetical protein
MAGIQGFSLNPLQLYLQSSMQSGSVLNESFTRKMMVLVVVVVAVLVVLTHSNASYLKQY